MARKPLVVIGMLGPVLEAGAGPKRWQRWRPTVSLCQHEDLVVDRLELLHQRRFAALAETIVGDVAQVSPETAVRRHVLELQDPWSLGEVYAALHDWAKAYPFQPEKEDYLVHITTGTHIVQIVMFLLTESRYLPARLVQTSPGGEGEGRGPAYGIIDLDLSKYDQLASRFRLEQREGLSFLKSGIDTRSPAFNRVIERLERVAVGSPDPILVTGATGSGKSQLAKRLYALKKARRQVEGSFVEVNCATLRGDSAMSALFGHVKGAFTGAVEARPGLLRKADGGVLFLDEIGELGADEQAMLLRAIEDKTFYPVGSDKEVRSDFQLLAGTNRDLAAEVAAGRFREDLLARINLWTFQLPSLRERPEDVAPNLDYELEQCSKALKLRVTFSREARERFLAFATSAEAVWPGNFRDFNAAVRRLATLSQGGRVSLADVEEEADRLRAGWARLRPAGRSEARADGALLGVLGPERARQLDHFDRVQLEEVLSVCRRAKSMSDAGRQLFAVSRLDKKVANDADRLRKYLARFGLEWRDVAAG